MSFCLLTLDTLVCLPDSQWGTSRLASSTGHLAYRIQCEKMAKEGVLAGVLGQSTIKPSSRVGSTRSTRGASVSTRRRQSGDEMKPVVSYLQARRASYIGTGDKQN